MKEWIELHALQKIKNDVYNTFLYIFNLLLQVYYFSIIVLYFMSFIFEKKYIYIFYILNFFSNNIFI